MESDQKTGEVRMSAEFDEFVHPRHFGAFVEAARTFGCHILLRKTGRASLQWVGKPGYTGKRADMKAKTAKCDAAGYRLEGLVVSPEIHPGACKPGAMQEWHKSKHLITIPPNGFGDNDRLRGCLTPYVLQTNPRHRHYGCIALVENGLLAPHYVHGDYDLYAIIPAGARRDAQRPPVRPQPMVVNPPRVLGLEQRLELEAKAPVDHVGPLSFKVANFLNVKIGETAPGALGALMVNHGEQVNLGAAMQDHQEVLAFMPEPRGNELARILRNRQDHEAYYRSI
jgi:hypothetical protein